MLAVQSCVAGESFVTDPKIPPLQPNSISALKFEKSLACRYLWKIIKTKSLTTSINGRPRKNSDEKLTTPKATTIIRMKKITAPNFDMCQSSSFDDADR